MLQVGILVDVREDGTPLVDYTGNEFGPIPAKTAIPAANSGDTVLLVFQGGDSTCPIIMGVVRDRLEKGSPRRLAIAAKEIVVEGTKEIRLCCGESSLILRSDGKTVLKGREVLSRASRTNRIKGATVQLN
jgi:Domain of unknown function (DUF6484)